MCYVIVAQSCLTLCNPMECVRCAQSCPTLCNSLDWSHPGSSGHEIFQARILEWVAISFSRESSSPWDKTRISWVVGRLLTTEPSRLWTWFSLILNLNFTSLTQPCQIHWKLKCLSIASSLYFCFIDYTKAFDCVDHNKLWKILQETGIPDHLTCPLRNLYAGPQVTVETGHRKTDWLQIGKGVRQGCISPPCLFNLYIEYIMRNARLHEAQAGIKITGRNINNLRYVVDTTLMAESEEELKFLMKVKEEWKSWLKTQHSEN